MVSASRSAEHTRKILLHVCYLLLQADSLRAEGKVNESRCNIQGPLEDQNNM